MGCFIRLSNATAAEAADTCSSYAPTFRTTHGYSQYKCAPLYATVIHLHRPRHLSDTCSICNKTCRGMTSRGVASQGGRGRKTGRLPDPVVDSLCHGPSQDARFGQQAMQLDGNETWVDRESLRDGGPDLLACPQLVSQGLIVIASD